MSDYLDKALEKLEKEYKSGSYDRYASAMKAAVKKALMDFCRQDDEFSQAVVQGGTFSDCMKAVAKSVGSSISDLEAYRRAVRFYFPGAEIHVKMTIDLIGDAGKAESTQANSPAPVSAGLILDFTQFL